MLFKLLTAFLTATGFCALALVTSITGGILMPGSIFADIVPTLFVSTGIGVFCMMVLAMANAIHYLITGDLHD